MEDIKKINYGLSASFGYLLLIIFCIMFGSKIFISSINEKLLYFFPFIYIAYVCASNTILCVDDTENLEMLEDSSEFNKKLFSEVTLYLNVFFAILYFCFLFYMTKGSLNELSMNVVSLILVFLYAISFTVFGLNIAVLVQDN